MVKEEKAVGQGKKHTFLDFSSYFKVLEEKRGKPIFPEEIIYIPKPGGVGVGVIIDRVLYDLEAISQKKEVEL